MPDPLLDRIDIPDTWEESVGTITKDKLQKIIVVGATDSGKSTYCSFLCQRLMQAGYKTAIVDADIGQKDVGPPAAITLGYPGPSRSLEDTEPEAFYFVGAVNPAGHLLPLVVGTRLLVDQATAPFIVINTTGLVHGPGRVLKGFKIEAVRPDVILAIGKSHDVSSILRPYRYFRVIRIQSSCVLTPKTPDDRRVMREKAFRRYFTHSVQTVLDLAGVTLQRTVLFTGKTVENPLFIHSEKTPEGILAIAKEPLDGTGNVKIIPAGFERDLVCGVSDSKNRCLGLAIVNRIDFQLKKVLLTTPVAPEKIRIIQFGDFYLSTDGRELGRKKPGAF